MFFRPTLGVDYHPYTLVVYIVWVAVITRPPAVETNVFRKTYLGIVVCHYVNVSANAAKAPVASTALRLSDSGATVVPVDTLLMYLENTFR